ncbi:hypothetical protein [Thermovenabulum sp.]|uniref:ribonuclease toxin HepT-like protein n=1 Tax=Thermovenabulum sp. TaxID=3100335 RepID=UPI003C7E3C75
MINKFLTLSARIRQELKEIEKAVDRSKKAWEKAHIQKDTLYLDSVALNIHDFYGGLERIFELIAENLDGIKPQGSNWHQELLRQMTVDIPKIRPAVIDIKLKNELDNYRAFRHIFRNVYAHNFLPEKMEPLMRNIEEVFNKIKESLERFCDFLESV